MPYIDVKSRTAVDPRLRELQHAIAGHTEHLIDRAGLYNYCITRLAVGLFPAKRYWVLALVCGVMVTATLEFYRRVVGPYEDDKCAENGDVY